MNKKPYPSEIQDRFIVRLPDGMRDRIAEAAKANGRSMNAEIVAGLEAALSKGATMPEIQDRAELLQEVLESKEQSVQLLKLLNKLGLRAFGLAQTLQEAALLIQAKESIAETPEGRAVLEKASLMLAKYREFADLSHRVLSDEPEAETIAPAASPAPQRRMRIRNKP